MSFVPIPMSLMHVYLHLLPNQDGMQQIHPQQPPQETPSLVLGFHAVDPKSKWRGHAENVVYVEGRFPFHHSMSAMVVLRNSKKALSMTLWLPLSRPSRLTETWGYPKNSSVDHITDDHQKSFRGSKNHYWPINPSIRYWRTSIWKNLDDKLEAAAVVAQFCHY
jgi:hypothetical protein